METVIVYFSRYRNVFLTIHQFILLLNFLLLQLSNCSSISSGSTICLFCFFCFSSALQLIYIFVFVSLHSVVFTFCDRSTSSHFFTSQADYSFLIFHFPIIFSHFSVSLMFPMLSR